jgi:hypothetical protein
LLARKNEAVTVESSIDERIAAIEERKASAMREFFAAFADEQDLTALKRQQQIDEAAKMVEGTLSAEVENFDEQAVEAEERARDLRARAAEIDPSTELFARLDAQADAARTREVALWQAREDAIVSVMSASEIARIDEHRAQVQAELGQLDEERETLLDQTRRAAGLREEAAVEDEAARGFRSEAAIRRARIEVLPEIARRQAVALHEREQRLRDQRGRVHKPAEPFHALRRVGADLIEDVGTGVLYNQDGYPVVFPS